MGRVERQRELARRRTRRAKLKKLRKKFAETNDHSKKTEIVAKVRRISPFTALEESASGE